MSDNQQQPETPWWHPDDLLGPGPSAVVAFTLAVLVLTGNTLMVSATLTLLGQYPGMSEDWGYIWATMIALLVPAIASGYLARRTITSAGVARWELVLGRAAMVLAVVSVGYTLLLTIGQVIQLG